MVFKKLRPNTQGATVLLLSGDLGAGKTTFSQRVGMKFGIEKTMPSPTFVLIRRYELKNKLFENIFHIDAYRLESEKEIEKLGFEEIVKNPKNLVLIEWPEKIKKILPKKVFKISIEHINEKERLVEVNRSF